jgi:hypothetical protein
MIPVQIGDAVAESELLPGRNQRSPRRTVDPVLRQLVRRIPQAPHASGIGGNSPTSATTSAAFAFS